MKILLKHKIFSFVLVFGLIAIFIPLFVLAAYKTDPISVPVNSTDRDFVVGPGKIELELKPGEKAIRNIYVSNRTGSESMFYLETQDFTGSRDLGNAAVLLGNDKGPFTLKDNLKVSQKTFLLKDGEKATIPVTISVPINADPGGRYGALLVSIISKPAELGAEGSSGKNAIISQIGVLFFVRIPGVTKEDGVLKEFSIVGGKSVFGSGPIGFRMLYENNGNVHLNPYGEIRIKNISGQEVGFVKIEPWFAMPDSLRLRETSWNREYLFGRYTATAFINRGYGNIVDEMNVTFWIIPWGTILLVLLSIVIVVVIIRWFFRRFEFRKKVNDVKENKE